MSEKEFYRILKKYHAFSKFYAHVSNTYLTTPRDSYKHYIEDILFGLGSYGEEEIARTVKSWKNRESLKCILL